MINLFPVAIVKNSLVSVFLYNFGRKYKFSFVAAMAIITLISDMGLKDYYVAAVKGSIYRHFPEVTLVDISHNVTPFNIAEAAFLLRQVYADFPEGTVHIIAVAPEEIIYPRHPESDILHVAIRFNGQYFVGADNGVFGMIFDREPEEIVQITLPHEADDLTFPVKTRFAPAAAHLARGGTLSVIGKAQSSYRSMPAIQPMHSGNTLRGIVTHIDAYGNVFTNIRKTLFKETQRKRAFTLYAGRENDHEIETISNTYNDVAPGDALALFTTGGYLQIAINKGAEGAGGGAAKLMGLHINDVITIVFEDTPSNISEL